MIVATDRDTESVYVHALDGSDLTWIPHLWRCNEGSKGNIYSYTDDYVDLGLFGESSYSTGAWCAIPETEKRYFICEGLI